jgi:hypothetical protein
VQKKLLIRVSDLTSLLCMKHSKLCLHPLPIFCCPSKSRELWKFLIQPAEEAGLVSEHAATQTDGKDTFGDKLSILLPATTGFLLSISFEHEDGSEIFL